MRPKITARSSAVAGGWAVLVVAALAVTLRSLRTEDFDGLNNMFQIPLALPWFLIPIGGIWSNETDAWILASVGWFSSLLILLFLEPVLLRRSRS